MIDRTPLRQLVRFGLTGLLSNAAGYGLYLLATHGGIAPKTAMTLLYVACSTLSYLVNRTWTFSHTGSLFSPALRYIAIQGVGYCINLSMLYYFVDVTGFPHQGVQAVAIIVVALFLFIACKYLVFPVTPPAPGRS